MHLKQYDLLLWRAAAHAYIARKWPQAAANDNQAQETAATPDNVRLVVANGIRETIEIDVDLVVVAIVIIVLIPSRRTRLSSYHCCANQQSHQENCTRIHSLCHSTLDYPSVRAKKTVRFNSKMQVHVSYTSSLRSTKGILQCIKCP